MGRHYEEVQEYYSAHPGVREKELKEEYEAIKLIDASNSNRLRIRAACGFPLVRPPVDCTHREFRARTEDMREKMEPVFKRYAQAQTASWHNAKNIILD